MSATNVACSGKRGNICVGNNVSATMCPRLPGPLGSLWYGVPFTTRCYAEKSVLVVDLFTGTKKGTVARGTKWEEVAENFNKQNSASVL